MSRVIVIGGGLAGLSAATALAERGHEVTVLEGRQVLGGRAYSFRETETKAIVDNGQHLLMGCYSETFRFFKRIGAMDRLDVCDKLDISFVGPEGLSARLSAWPAPAPWHLLGGLLRLSTLSWRDRFNLRFVQTALQNDQPQELDRLSVDAWLTKCRQSDRAKHYLWDPITIACLNEDPKVASALPFVAVLKQAFFGDAAGSRIAMAKSGLSELYVEPALTFLEKHVACVHTQTPVEKLEMVRGSVARVRLRDGKAIEADVVISAVPPDALLKMLPEEEVQKPFFAGLSRFEYAPIVSIHVWLDRPITDANFIGLLDTRVQWVFNRQDHLSCVISAAHAFVDWEKSKILEMTIEELRTVFPRAKDAKVLRSLVIKEHHATLSLKTGSDAFRPSHESPIENLWIAGDWTQTGLPATIESACVSGHRCANLVKEVAHV